MTATRNAQDLRRYFARASAGIDRMESGLKELNFGEFLVESRVIDRHQLLRALQLQDRRPGVRIGECIAALGYLPYPELERQLDTWNRIAIVDA